MTKKKGTFPARKITVTAILAALSSALMFLSFPVPLMPGFIKFDFSELPALLGSFALGPWYGVAICLVKNLVNMLKTQTGCIGELANFILGSVFVGVAGAVYKRKKTRKRAFFGSLAGAVSMTLIGIASNYFIIYPIYAKMMPMEVILGMYQTILPGVDTLLQALLIFNAPFTFIKGMINVLITFLIYKKVAPVLKGIDRT